MLALLALFCALGRFLAVFLFFASKFSPKNRKNLRFWSLKTLPKSIQKALNRILPKDPFFIEFCSIFVACCKGRTSNFVRPRNVLLALHTIGLFDFGMLLGSEILTKYLPKRCPHPSKIDAKNGLSFNIAFLGFRPRFGILLGLQVGPKCSSWALLGASWPALGPFLSALGTLLG